MADDIITKPFRVTLKDHVSFGLVSYYRTVFLTPWALFYAAMISGFPVLIYATTHNISSTLPTLALMAGLWLLFVPVVCMFSIWRTYRSSRLINSLHTGRLTEAGFEVEADAFKSMMLWPNFRKIRVNRDKIFLYLTSGAAHIIPKSAFVEAQEIETFIQRATESIAAARHTTAAVFEAPQETPAPSQWQSLPFHYTFFTHVTTYIQLSYGAMLKPFTLVIGPTLIAAVLLWVNRYDIMEGYWYDIGLQATGFTLFYVVFLLIYPWLMLPFSWLGVRKTAAIRGPRTVSLMPDRMISHGQTYHAELNWADLKGVRKRFGQILVYTRPNCAIITPTSAFPDKAAANAFYNQAVTYFKIARAAAKSTAAAKTLDEKA